ncbi:hypothetical protein J6590_063432 [Homalodisca vitripennis]|nr:hypothetical protein J6590_063432 [Homalodisca vitripennis]
MRHSLGLMRSHPNKNYLEKKEGSKFPLSVMEEAILGSSVGEIKIKENSTWMPTKIIRPNETVFDADLPESKDINKTQISNRKKSKKKQFEKNLGKYSTDRENLIIFQYSKKMLIKVLC